MLYKTLKIGDKELKLRLRSRDCVDLENKLGESPLDVLVRCSQSKMPTVGFIVETLHASLQAYEHGYGINETYDLYDEYIDNGGDLTEMLEIITAVFEVSGFFKTEKAEKKLEKVTTEN